MAEKDGVLESVEADGKKRRGWRLKETRCMLRWKLLLLPMLERRRNHRSRRRSLWLRAGKCQWKRKHGSHEILFRKSRVVEMPDSKIHELPTVYWMGCCELLVMSIFLNCLEKLSLD